ncbi:MAG: hypothetical protein ACI3XJ_13650 [Oscillospiraceae bacterium]
MNFDFKNIDINLANLILQSVFPTNIILTDDKGVPSVMVRIPKLTLKELGISDSDEVHPAFIVNGKEVEALYFSKYPNVVVDGVAASLPNEIPQGGMSVTDSIKACNNKGKGWHLMSRAEYALIALVCVQQGYQPKGNNCAGKDYRDKISTAVRTGEKFVHTFTGTGPEAWYHNNSYSGIADLNGNTCDWIGAVRLSYGELQVLPNNDSADNTNSQDIDSDKWMAIDGTTGEYIKPQGDGKTPNSLKLDFYGRDTSSHDPTLFVGWQWITGEITNSLDKRRGMPFGTTVAEMSICEKAKEKLKALCLLPPYDDPNIYGSTRFFANNGKADARCFCGGRELDRGDSGVFFCRIGDVMEYATPGTGFRCAYAQF